jgi:type VI secretion system protein ImpH
MAAENGRKGAGLSDQLFAEPYRFDFFQAVRLLERYARERADDDPRWPRQPVGLDQAPDQEVARFRTTTSLAFPAGSVSQIKPPAPNGSAALRPPEMTVTFLGLTGPEGALPLHYSSLLIQRLRTKDFSLRDFLDVFNHRVVSLFFRAWTKYRLPVAYERSRINRSGEEDLAAWCLYCLVGLGTRGMQDRLGLADEVFLHYSGHYAHLPRTAVSLECLLGDYFHLPVRVFQAQGQWLTLDEQDRSLMPGADQPLGRNCQLGLNLIVGERVWDVQSKFRVRVGPLDYERFRRFLPGGDGLRDLYELTRTYVGPDLDFDVQVVLMASKVPECRLSSDEGQIRALGCDAWIRCVDFAADVDDAVFATRDV